MYEKNVNFREFSYLLGQFPKTGIWCTMVQDLREKPAEGMEKLPLNTKNEQTLDKVLAGVLAVLVIALALVLAARETAYTRQENALKKEAQANSAAWTQAMDRLIEEEDYLGYAAFTAARKITTDREEYRDYYAVDYMIDQFTTVYRDFVQVIYPRDDYVKSYTMESFYEDLDRFYTVTEWEYWASFGEAEHESEILSAAEGMDRQMQALLRTHFGLSKKDAASLRTMKKAKRDGLLEERITALREQSPEDAETEEEAEENEENVH